MKTVKLYDFKLRGFLVSFSAVNPCQAGNRYLSLRSGLSADGVIIGSKIVKMIEDNLGDKEKIKTVVKDFISAVKASL